jgi:hypothetical protein
MMRQAVRQVITDKSGSTQQAECVVFHVSIL